MNMFKRPGQSRLLRRQPATQQTARRPEPILKSPREIQIMREAGRIVARVHEALAGAVRPGVSTWDLDQLAFETMARYNATSCFLGYRGFPANICASIKYRGVVTACGLAGGMDFPATVAPFILRGVTLAGIDSVMCPRADRLEAWRRLGADLDITKLDMISSEISLAEAIPAATKLINGEIRGRIIVDVNR